ncbi:hypothetical protein AWB74_05513 [Caballeronia arvi]|uniref:HNH nuclease domain-containing protein n=1 Tax=Caballeronia arvi TaxID=1777135 RepID=A0A158KE07_9BURK|nr:HNH endonuclease signature motif containing protein [Caballeronia arvi]SAL79294.1 hypothetical protein AWB74_05513 [Caballeronia arvi]
MQWFDSHKGQEVSWPQPLQDGTLVATKAKGIYKPKDIDYAVSVRQSLGGPYADLAPKFSADGAWTYRYFQEQLDPAQRDSQYTNRGLLACRDHNIPVGVMLQVKRKPNPRYQVLGLAHVTDWKDGYFLLSSVQEARETGTEASVERLEGAVRSAAMPLPLSFEDERRWIDATIVLREGQGAFRTSLLQAYDHRCAISGCDVVQVLEAAHIHRYFGEKTNDVRNGLLLRADLHTLYDRALIAIEPKTYEVFVSPKLRDSEYGSLANRRIRLPRLSEDQPDTHVLLEHKRWVLSRWDADFDREKAIKSAKPGTADVQSRLFDEFD